MIVNLYHELKYSALKEKKKIVLDFDSKKIKNKVSQT